MVPDFFLRCDHDAPPSGTTLHFKSKGNPTLAAVNPAADDPNSMALNNAACNCGGMASCLAASYSHFLWCIASSATVDSTMLRATKCLKLVRKSPGCSAAGRLVSCGVGVVRGVVAR